MKVLFVSVEVAPFAKVGGLADVAGALPKALRRLGIDARIVMPLYRMIDEDPRWELDTTLNWFDVRMGRNWVKPTIFKETVHEGVPIGFIGTDEWFPKAVSSETLYQPGGMQHLFFSTAILRSMEKIGWIPDVVHCNDWHTGFLPALMREKASPIWEDVASVFTIHNFAYQGEFGMEVLDSLDLPHDIYTPEKVEAWGRVNFLKTGCVYADRVNTVSPNYAREIQTPEYGCHLDGLMRHLAAEHKLSGILNGIDLDTFNPATDPAIPANFSVDNISNKAKCKEKLLAKAKLKPIDGAPLFGVVSRLSSQKGIDLIIEAADAILSLPSQLIIQGLGDPALIERLRKLERTYPKHFRLIDRFDADMAQCVYAGCDGFLMPSSFEPCGLGQLIAMRYGTIPIARSTGGLADTVFEGKNGFVFSHRAAMDLLAAVERAHDVYTDPTRWKKLVQTAMAEDHGWDTSAKEYADLFALAKDDRRAEIKTA